MVVGHAYGPSSVAADPTPIQPGGELVATIRSEPATYNRYAPAGGRAATDLLTLLTHAPLVRINRTTDQIEPWLAESWATSADGLTHTLKLREGVKFSDGQPLTSADVLFSFRVVYDPVFKSGLQPALSVKGKPLAVRAPDPHTVVIVFPEAFAPGLRLLDVLPILPKHKLEAALDAGKLAEEWVPAKPLTDIAGLGPFVLSEHVAGQRLVLTRNAHYFRRDAVRRATAVSRPADPERGSRPEHRSAAPRGRRGGPDVQRRDPAAGLCRLQTARGTVRGSS